jgi:hypothetical protein
MSRNRSAYEDQILDDEVDVNLNTLAPNTIRRTKARDKLRETDWDSGEAKITIGIKELKFSGKKVPGGEIITMYRGERRTVGVPFKKKLSFAFPRVEDEMIFKFAVASHGDLLGFIYLEIPQKFRTMKTFRLDDWFPVKQIEVDEEEVIKMENFVARIIIDYKAKRKVELNELFSAKIPREKVYKMLAKNLRSRIKTINDNVSNFKDKGFEYLGDMERRLLEKRMEFNTKRKHLGDSKYKGKKDLLTTHKQTFYKGNAGPVDRKRKLKATSKVAEVFHKDTGKDVLLKGGDLEKKAEELLKELTKTKRDLVDKNQRIRGLMEGKMNVDNNQLKRTLEGVRADLLRDKKELGIKLTQQTKAIALEKRKLGEQHQNDMEECGEMKDEIMDVMGEYEEKYRQLEKLEDEMGGRQDNLDETSQALKDRLNELNDEESKMIEERKALDELEEELDQLRERMLLERQKIYKEAEKFSYDKGDISTKDRQLALQQEILDSERKKLDKERDQTFDDIEKRREQLNKMKAAAQGGSGGFEEMKKEYTQKIADLMQEKKANKKEEERLKQEAKELEREMAEYNKLKNVADKEKEEDQKTLENDYDFIEQQMADIDVKRKELDKMQKGLEDYQRFLKEQDASNKLEKARFMQERENFFNKVEMSEFNPDELMKIAKNHGMDLEVSDKAALLQEKREVEMERKKNKLRATIVSLNKTTDEKEMNERKKKMNDRRSTMVNRLSMTGQNLNALRMEHKFSNKQVAAKFLDGLFDEALAENSSKKREEKKGQMEDLRQEIEAAKQLLMDTKAKVQKAKLDYFMKAKKKKITVKKKRMSLRPKKLSVLKSKPAPPKEEVVEESEPKTNVDTDVQVITKTITRMDSQGNEVIETITETITTTKEEVIEEEEAAQEPEAEPEVEEEEEEEMEEYESEYEEEVEVEEEFDPNTLPKNLLELKEQLHKLCDETVNKLENAKPNISNTDKVDEKTALLGGGKNCIGNIFQVIHVLNNAPDTLDNAVLKEMEEENMDFDFDAVRRQYEEKIMALVTYIKRIRSNYNFFNQGIDRNLLVK